MQASTDTPWFLEHGVYFEESQSSVFDILLFLEFNVLRGSQPILNVVNQYCWRGKIMLWYQVFHIFLAMCWAAALSLNFMCSCIVYKLGMLTVSPLHCGESVSEAWDKKMSPN